MTGLLAAYQFSPVFAANCGVADSWNVGINARSSPPKAESFKTYLGSVTLTAPKDLGW